MEIYATLDAIYREIVQECPQLHRGRVWCKTCGREQAVDSAECLRRGWPKCCGYTMTLDSPEERKREPRS